MGVIDKDELQKKYSYYCNHLERHVVDVDDIENMPTVDAEPVVRCKDCKYFKFGNGCFLQSVDYDWEEQMGANDFCSRGDKR